MMMGFGFDEEPLTTIRISNIPSHTNEADFNFWFLFAKGFQQATLAPGRGGGTQTGWVRFTSVEEAQMAMSMLDGRQLVESPEGCTLAVEFAKKNFKPSNPMKKRPYEEDQSGFGQPDASQWGLPPLGGAVQSYDPAKFDPAQFDPAVQTAPTAQSYDPAKFDPADYGVFLAEIGKGVQGAGATATSPAIGLSAGLSTGLSTGLSAWATASNAITSAIRSSAPSTTLFIGRLAETVTEEEMNAIFPSLHGFERMKFVPPTDGKSGMCFAKFYTAETAEEALRVLSGYRLPSSPGSPLQVQFAKNDLDQPSGRLPPAVAQASMTQMPSPSALAAGLRPGAINPECDTAFIGNLAPTVTEQDLTSVLLAYPGFVRCKFLMGPRPMAFALFDGIETCKMAIDSMHGQALPTAPEQAMLVQYAKNSLDKPPPKWARQM